MKFAPLSLPRKILLAAFVAAILLVLALQVHILPFHGKTRPISDSLAETTASTSLPFFRPLHVPILIYHSIMPQRPGETPLDAQYTVPPNIFGEQLAYLKVNGFNVISFEKLIDAMATSTNILPPKPVVITFDDGWENQYREAFPLLQKYDDTATFFIFTNGMSNKDFMTWSQLKTMQEAGMTIGSHSESHPYLFTITDETQLEKEIMGSRDLIAMHLGKIPDLFAYPFGKYTDLDIQIVKAAGYRAARADLGWAASPTSSDPFYKLNGYQATEDMSSFRTILALP